MSRSGVEIRLARPDEYDVLGELTVDAYRALGLVGDGYAAELRDVAGRAATTDVLVAVDGEGRVLGGLAYVPGPGPLAEFDDADAAGIRMLAVAPEARRAGAGEALVRACIDRAVAAGRRRIVLHTTRVMTDAHRLYERLGFRRAPELDWDPGIMLLAYTLDITVDA